MNILLPLSSKFWKRFSSTMFGRLHLDLYAVLSSDHRSVNEADRCSACTLTNEPSRGTRRTRRSLARHSIQMFRLIRLLVAPADAPQKCRFFPPATLPFFLSYSRRWPPRRQFRRAVSRGSAGWLKRRFASWPPHFSHLLHRLPITVHLLSASLSDEAKAFSYLVKLGIMRENLWQEGPLWRDIMITCWCNIGLNNPKLFFNGILNTTTSIWTAWYHYASVLWNCDI